VNRDRLAELEALANAPILFAGCDTVFISPEDVRRLVAVARAARACTQGEVCGCLDRRCLICQLDDALAALDSGRDTDTEVGT